VRSSLEIVSRGGGRLKPFRFQHNLGVGGEAGGIGDQLVEADLAQRGAQLIAGIEPDTVHGAVVADLAPGRTGDAVVEMNFADHGFHYFEQADGGTLFLDEIGDMPLSMQVKLLRALQERCITRVGGEGSIPVQLRLVCATHRNLKEMVLAGEFREDLYYRINVVELRVPPLRERREDIIALSKQFLAEFARDGEMPQVLSPAVEQALKEYPWPGNIRELKNTLERATLLSDGRIIAAENLFPDSEPKTMSRSLRDYLAESERDFILRALEAADWKIQTCADAIGISRKNLWEKMRKLGIEKDEQLD